MQKKEWFESWFDSPFYHILYKDRDEKEAQLLLDNLISFLNPGPGAKILDVACGKGRHATHLHSKGFDVTGFDLSRESIEFDKKYFEDDCLSLNRWLMCSAFTACRWKTCSTFTSGQRPKNIRVIFS